LLAAYMAWSARLNSSSGGRHITLSRLCDAYTGGAFNTLLVDPKGLCHRLDNFSRHSHCYLGILGQLLQQDHKFIPGETGYEIRLADQLFQTLCKLNQQLITGSMSVAVINLLETIQIEEQQCQSLSATFNSSKGLRQTAEQGMTIGQAGERILQGLLP